VRPDERSFQRGEIVYLLVEVRVGGQIHEIGTRAAVLADLGSEISLALEGEGPTVTCPRAHVELPAQRSRTRARRIVYPRARPTTA
jgi:hypothetical protein